MGRTKGMKHCIGRANYKSCHYCEGTGRHFSESCGACDGTGEERVRKQLQKVYNAKNKLPINYNLAIK